jgi:hypothetical protein
MRNKEKFYSINGTLKINCLYISPLRILLKIQILGLSVHVKKLIRFLSTGHDGTHL